MTSIFYLGLSMVNLQILITKDNGKWHMSISRAERLPTWEEIRDAWYENVPGAKEMTGAIYLPPLAEYVNEHPYCMHVWEV